VLQDKSNGELWAGQPQQHASEKGDLKLVLSSRSYQVLNALQCAGLKSKWSWHSGTAAEAAAQKRLVPRMSQKFVLSPARAFRITKPGSSLGCKAARTLAPCRCMRLRTSAWAWVVAIPALLDNMSHQDDVWMFVFVERDH